MICWKQKLKHVVAVVAVFELQEAVCSYTSHTPLAAQPNVTNVFTLREDIYWTNKIEWNKNKYLTIFTCIFYLESELECL